MQTLKVYSNLNDLQTFNRTETISAVLWLCALSWSSPVSLRRVLKAIQAKFWDAVSELKAHRFLQMDNLEKLWSSGSDMLAGSRRQLKSDMWAEDQKGCQTLQRPSEQTLSGPSEALISSLAHSANCQCKNTHYVCPSSQELILQNQLEVCYIWANSRKLRLSLCTCREK